MIIAFFNIINDSLTLLDKKNDINLHTTMTIIIKLLYQLIL